MAARNLDSVRYESAIRTGDDGEVIVEFIDHIGHSGAAHTYRCGQRTGKFFLRVFSEFRREEWDHAAAFE